MSDKFVRKAIGQQMALEIFEGSERVRKTKAPKRVRVRAKRGEQDETYDCTGHQFGRERWLATSSMARQGVDYNITANYRQNLRRIHDSWLGSTQS